MADGIDLEMRDINRIDTVEPAIDETSFDFPQVPRGLEQSATDLQILDFVADARKTLNLNGAVDSKVYRSITIGGDGNFYYNHKLLTYKRGSKFKLYSNGKLQSNPDSREFLKLIGYNPDVLTVKTSEQARELETVSPRQTEAIKSKIKSFKITEEWAREEKEKATRQLAQSTDANEKQKFKELVVYYEQLELQARRRSNEVIQNQFQRINEIINDKTKSLSERLKELFRRDGLTIGAIITALGMTISTIIFSVFSSSTPGGPPPTPDAKPPNAAKRVLIKISNWLHELAKKALAALPGVIGSVISFLLKKASEAVLFLSEHLIILFVSVIAFIYEFILTKRYGRR